ncbi:MAG: cyclic pyranopterin monophosphate synthase MoaC [Planctomycetota bacterium]|jgi:cyclic pyranopterin phosphate synthase
MSELSHLDEHGKARMVDVGDKEETERAALAEGRVEMAPETLARVLEGGLPKGDVIATARIAGIQAAKRTPDLVPLCHPVRSTSVDVQIEPEGEDALLIRARTRARDRTGVEMEALAAVSAAGLTVYDMVKAVDRGARITGIRLLEKSGGRSGRWERGEG